jgi:methylenetetrahydrofolate dehydrogenase (NADP+)/methenyltetrahydrofolate cyclohydrolase
MTARLIDGRALAQHMRAQFRQRTAELVAAGVQPGLAVILVGDSPASRVYVGNKVRACDECGVRSVLHTLPAETDQADLLGLIERLKPRRGGARQSDPTASACPCQHAPCAGGCVG